MTDLTTFLAARLDEDEVAARAAADVAGPDWTWKTEVTIEDEVTEYVTSLSGALLLDTMGGIESEAPHVARHDPARTLREVQADRKLLAAYAEVAHMDTGDPEPEYAYGRAAGLGEAVRLRAASYGDHPDYRQEWAL